MEKLLRYVFPIWAIEHDCILSKQGDVTIAYRVELPECFTLSDEDYENLHQAWIKAVKSLPKHCVVHKQDWFTQGIHTPAGVADSFLGKSADRHFNGRSYFDHTCYVYLSFLPTGRKATNSLLSNLIRPALLPEETLKANYMQELSDKAGHFAQLLTDSHLMSLSRLKAAELGSQRRATGLIERYCYLSGGDTTPLHKDLAFEGELCIGDQHTAIYSLGSAEDLPEMCGSRMTYGPHSTDQTKFPLSFAAPLGLLLEGNHIYNQYIFLGDGRTTLKQIEKKRLRLESLSAYSRENAISRDACSDFLNEAIGQQRRPVRAHFNVMVWADNPAELKILKNKAASALAKLDAAAKIETIGAPQIWWAGIPGNAGAFPVNDTFDTFAEQACCFLNLETNYRSDRPETGIRFCDRLSGRPVYTDLLDAPRASGIASNMGMLICGTSGGGKSMTANHILHTLFDQGAHCLTVDIGGSYEGLCDEAGGCYFAYHQDHPISFNPFYLSDGDYFDPEKNESLKELLRALWKADDESVKRSEYVAISAALQGYYQNLRDHPDLFPCFDTFYEYVRDDYTAELTRHKVSREMFDLDNFLYVLRPFYQGGEFSFLLNARENLDLLSERFIVVELDNIKDHPILLPVVTLVIIETFISKIRKLGGSRKVFLIDEAWKAISKSGMAHFAQYAFKTIRKFNGVPIVSTQELDDLIGNPVIKDAIINNADIKILMDMKKYLHKFDALQQTLGLSEKAKTILLSIDKSKREIFIDIGGQVQKVYRNELCPEEYYTYTTDGMERVRVQELAALHGSYQKGVEAMIKERSTQ